MQRRATTLRLRLTVAIFTVGVLGHALPDRAAQTSAAVPACDRNCLAGLIADYLAALQTGDVARLPVSSAVRFTEDQQDRKLGTQGIWAHKVLLSGYRLDVLDVPAGVAGTLVKVRIDGTPALLALRLITSGRRIAGIESMVVHSRAEGMIFDVDAVRTLSKAMAYTPTRAQRNSREDMIAIASRYPQGLQAGSFVKVDVPFAPEAYRFENGRLMAGPGCTFLPGCEHIKTQHIPTLAKLVYRIAAVDERQGLVLIRMDFGPGSVFATPGRPKGQSLSVFEVFKVYGGQIHAVEAFMKMKPADQPLGWSS